MKRTAIEDPENAIILEQLKNSNVTLIAHYYTDHKLQYLAEASGGCVADSLAMAKFGVEAPTESLIVAGVYFMGETAKILSPEKNVYVLDHEATCSLDIGCPVDDLRAFKKQHPDRTLVVYANTSAGVKAEADWVVTSSNAVDIITMLQSRGERILWAPDKYLGQYIQHITKADMVLWDGSCIVHEEFKASLLKSMKSLHQDAAVLVHPESPTAVIELADVVGSTSRLIEAAKERVEQKLIVATEKGIFYKMQQAVPDKQLLIAPTGGSGATCKSCAQCPWMAMNSVAKLKKILMNPENPIIVDDEVSRRAKIALGRMVNFNRDNYGSIR